MNINSELNDIKIIEKEISFNGRNLRLAYDYRAYAMIEEATGKSVYELKDDFLNGKIGMKNHLIVLYFGLLRHQNDLSFDEFTNYVHIGHFLSNTLQPTLEAFFSPLLPPRVSLDDSIS